MKEKGQHETEKKKNRMCYCEETQEKEVDKKEKYSEIRGKNSKALKKVR